MSDLIGRFLSFDEHLGRGLVKFAYFVSLFYVVVIHLFMLVAHLIDLDFGRLLLVPFKFLIWVLLIRVAAELVLAVLSIDDHLQDARAMGDGFEAGLTPDPHAAASGAPTQKAEAPTVVEDTGDEPERED